MSWRPNESRRPWRDNRRGRGGYGFHRENRNDRSNRHDRPWSGSHRHSVVHSKPHRPSRDPSPEDEARAEKMKNASLVKNKLNSLTVKDKSESMKQLLTTTANEELTDKPKETKEVATIEKESRRIAHVPKPIIKPVPPPPTLPPLLAEHLEADIDIENIIQRERIERSLLQDLIAMPIKDLKNMVEKPKSKDNHFLTHLMKKTRVSLSDAMRKLAEHKLQIVGSENPLTELENLVDTDLAVDVCRMPVETIQALRDIFNMNLDGDLELMEPPPPPVLRSDDWENMEQADMDLETESDFPAQEESTGQFLWHTPYNIDPNRSFIPTVPSEQPIMTNCSENINNSSLNASINYSSAILNPGINAFNFPMTVQAGASPIPKSTTPVPPPAASPALSTGAVPRVKPEPSPVLQPTAPLAPKPIFPAYAQTDNASIPQSMASFLPKPPPPPPRVASPTLKSVASPSPSPSPSSQPFTATAPQSVLSPIPQPLPSSPQPVTAPALQRVLSAPQSPAPQPLLSTVQPVPLPTPKPVLVTPSTPPPVSSVPQPVPAPVPHRLLSAPQLATPSTPPPEPSAPQPVPVPVPHRLLSTPKPVPAPRPVPPPEPLQIIIERNKQSIDYKRHKEKQEAGVVKNAEIDLHQVIKLEKEDPLVPSSTDTHGNQLNANISINLPLLRNVQQGLSISNSQLAVKADRSQDNSKSREALKKLSLHDKLVNMGQLNQPKESKKTFAAQSTQTKSKRLKNRSTQCHVHKLISRECQITPIPVAKSTQSVQTQFQRFHKVTQTIERTPFQDAVAQTDFTTSSSEQSSQTDAPSRTFVDNFTQHTVLFSNRGEQVNMTFFTANKYSQTKAPEQPKQVKNTDSAKKDNAAEVTSMLLKEAVGNSEPSVSAESIEKSSVFKEFSTLQNDIKALGTGSFLRRRLVSSMLDLMGSTFTNFSNLFSDILERSNRQELKESKSTSNNKQLYQENKKRSRSVSSSSDDERRSVKHKETNRDKKTLKRTKKYKEKSHGANNALRKESSVTKDAFAQAQSAKKRKLLGESDEDSLDSMAAAKGSRETPELANHSSKKKVKNEEDTSHKTIKKESKVKLPETQSKISDETSQKLSTSKEKINSVKNDNDTSNKIAKKEVANLPHSQSKHLNETQENATPPQEKINLHSGKPGEKTITKENKSKLPESKSTISSKLNKPVKKVFEKDTKVKKIDSSEDDEEDIKFSSKSSLKKDKKVKDNDGRDHKHDKIEVSSKTNISKDKRFNDSSDDDEFEVTSKTSLKKWKKLIDSSDDDGVQVSSKTSLKKDKAVVDSSDDDEVQVSSKNSRKDVKDKESSNNYDEERVSSKTSLKKTKVKTDMLSKWKATEDEENDSGSESVQRNASPSVQRSYDWYRRKYKLRDCFVKCFKISATLSDTPLPGSPLPNRRRISRISSVSSSSTNGRDEASLPSEQREESKPDHSPSGDNVIDLNVPHEHDSSSYLPNKSEPSKTSERDGEDSKPEEDNEVNLNSRSRSLSPQLKSSSSSPPGGDGHPIDPDAESNRTTTERTEEEAVEDPNHSQPLLDAKSITTASGTVEEAVEDPNHSPPLLDEKSFTAASGTEEEAVEDPNHSQPLLDEKSIATASGTVEKAVEDPNHSQPLLDAKSITTTSGTEEEAVEDPNHSQPLLDEKSITTTSGTEEEAVEDPNHSQPLLDEKGIATASGTEKEGVEDPNHSPPLLDEKSITTASELSAHDFNDDVNDVKRKHLVGQIEFVGHNEAITHIKISSNHLLAASGKNVICFSFKSGKRKRMYSGHKTSVTCLCLLAKRDGEVIYSGSHDNIIRAFSVQTSTLLRSTSGLLATPLSLVSSGSWSSNGIIYGFLSNGDIISFNPKTLKIERKDETGDPSFLSGIAAEVNCKTTFFISTSKCKVFQTAEESGNAPRELDWECEVPAEQLVYHEGSLYCGSKLPQIIAFNISAESVIRSVINCSGDTVGLCIVEHCLLVGSRFGEFTVFDVSTQTVQDTFTKAGNFNLLKIHKKMIIGSCENGKLIGWPLPQRVRKILQR